MGLRLITGRAIAGKTGVLYQAVIQAAEKGRASVLLLPSFADVMRARQELAERTPVGIRIDSMDNWARHLWMTYGTGRHPIGTAARLALMECAVAEATNPVASTRGYLSLLSEVARRSAGMPLPPVASGSEREVATHLARYRELCAQEGLIEPAEMLFELARMDVLAGATVSVNRFTDLSPAQQSFVLGLARDNEVLLALPWEDDAPALEANEALVNRFVQEGAVIERLPVPGPGDELSRLERRLFDSGEPLTPTGMVDFMTAAGAEAECALVASTTRRLLDEGFLPGDIAVVFRDVAKRAHLLHAAFAAEGVAVAVDAAVPLREAALTRSAAALVAVVSGTGGREAMVAFLASPYSGAAPAVVEEFDTWSRKHRVEDSNKLLSLARAKSGARTRAVIDAAREVAGRAMNAEGVRSWAELLRLLVENGRLVPERVAPELMLDGSAARALLEGAEELARLSRVSPPGRKLLDYVEGAQAHSGGQEREGSVYVTEAHRLRSRRFAAVVVAGLSAEEFSSEKPEPLRAALLRRLGLPAGTEERLSERLLFYSVVTRAMKRLILVRQSSTADGVDVRPSVFWDEVLDLYRSPEEAESGEDPVPCSASLPLSELQEAAPAYSRGRRDLRRSIREGRLKSAESDRGALSDVPWTDEDREFSLTELETYYSCPYKWFYERVVRPREIDTTFAARERGTLIHEALATFYRRLREQGTQRVSSDNVAEATQLWESVWAEVSAPAIAGSRTLEERQSISKAGALGRRAIMEDANRLLGFVPAGMEWAFGESEGVRFSFAGVRLKGKVDRVDFDGGRLVVTDYKSSEVEGHGNFQAKGRLQVLVYALATEAHWPGRVAGAFYRSLAKGELRGFWNTDVADAEPWVANRDIIDDEGVSELLDWAAGVVSESVEGIRVGHIAPGPRLKDSCKWCSANSFCGMAQR